MISKKENENLSSSTPSDSDEFFFGNISLDDGAVTDNVAQVPERESQNLLGPGQLLNRKREALGMTLNEVADALHITMHYVRALESNAHDKLPGDVFVRGYIRAYANLLKLDPVVLINVYSEFTSQQASEQQASISRARRRKDRNLPWIIISGIAFVGIAIALWYFTARTPATPDVPPMPDVNLGASNFVPAQTIVPAPALNNDAPAMIDNVATTLATDIVTTRTAAETGPETASQITGLDEPVIASEPVITQTGAASNVAQGGAILDTPATGTPESPESPGEQTTETAPESLSAPAQEPVQSNPQAGTGARVISVDAGGEDVVQITFNGESMVQVEDGNDKQIYRDIRIAGDVLRIMGSAPFDILLGDAASTVLTLNGNSIDFTSNIRIDNSVRLTIGL